MNTDMLLDSWEAHGSEFEEFKRVLTDLAESTYTASIETSNLTLMHYRGSDDDRMIFNLHSVEQVEKKKNLITALSCDSFLKSGANKEFLDELMHKTKLMLRLDGLGAQRNDLYFASSHLSRDLASRAYLQGEAVYDPTDERDMYLMSRFIKTPVLANAIIRRNSENGNALHKVFAAPSDAYCYIDQTILLEMVQTLERELGKFECKFWRVDHYLTQLWLTFPERAEDVSKTYGLPDTLVPGVLLETSDTGDCALRVIVFWEKSRGALARIGLYSREHSGNVDESQVVETMTKSVLGHYTELPARLAELLTIDIPDKEAALQAIMHQVSSSKKLLQGFGKRRFFRLEDLLSKQLMTYKSMTAYDFALLFMDLPARIKIDDIYREAIDKISGAVPFFDFYKIAKASSKVSLKKEAGEAK